MVIFHYTVEAWIRNIFKMGLGIEKGSRWVEVRKQLREKVKSYHYQIIHTQNSSKHTTLYIHTILKGVPINPLWIR